MLFTKSASLIASASLVAGHGYISGIVAGGQRYTGYLVDSYSYMDSPPETIGWSTTATDLGFVSPSSYQSADIICHEDAKPGALTAKAQAGSEVQLEWTDWPKSHHGPVITYLAPCNGDCAKVDKKSLKFFKIDAKGLIDGSGAPGVWASDNLIDNNNTWTLTIPSDVASGNYVMRNEIIALHSAGNQDGAQNYPQCMNFQITGGGSAQPQGTAGTELYQADAPGILINIYTTLKNYVMPGPKGQFTGGSSNGGNSNGGNSNGGNSNGGNSNGGNSNGGNSNGGNSNGGSSSSKPTSSPTTMITATSSGPKTTSTPVIPSAPSSSAGGSATTPDSCSSPSASPTPSGTPGSGSDSGSGASDYGSCSNPSITWAKGLDGRKGWAFATNNQEDFSHGSSTTIATLTGFICNRLNSPCGAPQAMLDLCDASVSEVEASGLTGQDKAGLWNELMA